ncbi:MAG TPA: hypothetical protein VF345_04435 [Chthoniobacterales bacterium]
MDDAKRLEIEKALIAKGADKRCERCGNATFSIMDGYDAIPVLDDFRKVVLGGKTLPCAIVACNKCGNINLHALGALGLFEGKTAAAAEAATQYGPERSAK